MTSIVAETIFTKASLRIDRIADYLSAGKLLHAITVVELFTILLFSTFIGAHPLKAPVIMMLGIFLLFSQLDARSRFQEYKKVRDQLIEFGPDGRIFKAVINSRCQRDAALAAARRLGYATHCKACFNAAGYRWHHLLPDFVTGDPRMLLSRAFWGATFFAPGYQSRYPVFKGKERYIFPHKECSYGAPPRSGRYDACFAHPAISEQKAIDPMGVSRRKIISDRKSLVLVIVALIIGTPWVMAYEEVDDLVDIFATDRAFIAVIDGRRNFSNPIRQGETVQWEGAVGEVGAFLTSQRLLAVSVTSGQWNAQFLKINEKKGSPQMLLGAHLVVMLTDERIVGFGTHTGGFFQTRLPIGESITVSEAEGRVATAITPTRAFALSASRRGVAEIRFRIRETLQSIKTTYNKVTLRTSQRLITFEAADAVWRDFELK